MAIAKVDPAQRLVFGWAYVATDEKGSLIVDHQGDIIPVAELEKAAYAYVEESREAGEMHVRKAGALVESCLFTKEKCDAMGLPFIGAKWWTGFRVDPDTFAKVQSGELAELSIGGSAERVAV